MAIQCVDIIYVLYYIYKLGTLTPVHLTVHEIIQSTGHVEAEHCIQSCRYSSRWFQAGISETPGIFPLSLFFPEAKKMDFAFVFVAFMFSIEYLFHVSLHSGV